ncbi:uncharacterized protein N7459_004403 [Penicillium hispanicum]|uniref:uncharacterized protein n=1 Tax=Penicillium hispanicum TaxID=1080232 RepID=UPI0025413220|nr:uncharacterized protein N7459_004403 [Penicillium hispanicum]KAJ5584603.1 hypothetical protein N7459_004403 [Penicillium hispanicum]
MLIDGQKWACEACIRGHRVTSCKHHDRPLIRIKRKGRPFATCSICHSTPCEAPTEHARLKREAELKSPSKKAPHARFYPRHSHPNGFLPIAPRPTGPDAGRSSSTSGNEHEMRRAQSAAEPACVSAAASGAGEGAELSQSLSHSAPDALAPDPILAGDLFDSMYSLLPATSSLSGESMARTVPLVNPLEGRDPFEFPLDPALALDNGALGCLEEMEVDLAEGLAEEVFDVEDWSRYMWSPETGFEHLDTGFPPGSR